MDYSSRILNLDELLDRIKAHRSAPDVYDPPTFDQMQELSFEMADCILELEAKVAVAGKALNRLLHLYLATYSDLRIEAATKEEWAARAINAEAKGLIRDVHEEPEEDGQFVSDKSNIEGDE